MRFKLIIEYLGKNYCGWQRQDNALSVQEVLEEKLGITLQQKITLFGSGRTDSGVHAYGQVAHFDAESALSSQKIMFSVNSLLPDDIRVLDCIQVEESFHAQYNAKSKTYIYKAYVSKIQKPLKNGYSVRILPPLDVEKIKEAAKLLLGVHDFKAFSGSNSSAKTSVREIYRLEIKEDGEDLTFIITGNGFLFNMVRIIVGTLIYIGKNKIPTDNIQRMFESRERKLGGKTYPPEGLYLKEVIY